MAERIEELIKKRSEGIKRLDYLQTMEGYGDIVKFILETYDLFDDEDATKRISHQNRYKLAMRLLTTDLLLSNSYNSEGRPSEYLSAWNNATGKIIDPADYRYIDMDADKFKDRFTFLCNDRDIPVTQFMVINRYLEEFNSEWEEVEDPPIIVIPGEIYISQERKDKGVYLVYSSNFTPPFGTDDGAITIYRHKHHRVGYM